MCKKNYDYEKKMYLCLLLFDNTPRRRKKACLSHCLLHEHSALDDFEPP